MYKKNTSVMNLYIALKKRIFKINSLKNNLKIFIKISYTTVNLQMVIILYFYLIFFNFISLLWGFY